MALIHHHVLWIKNNVHEVISMGLWGWLCKYLAFGALLGQTPQGADVKHTPSGKMQLVSGSPWGPALRGCLLRLMFDNTKPIFPMTFSHLRQERSPSSRQRTYSTVINTQAFKNICDQKGLCFLISLQSRGGLRVRDRGKGKGERGRGRKGARNGGRERKMERNRERKGREGIGEENGWREKEKKATLVCTNKTLLKYVLSVLKWCWSFTCNILRWQSRSQSSLKSWKSVSNYVHKDR